MSSIDFDRRYNPFRPHSIVHPGMFSGRTHEIGLLKHSLIQAKHGNPYHLLIDGERGVGKSSLLLYFEYLASDPTFDGFNFVSLKIELESSTTYLELIQKFAYALQSAIASKEQLKTKATKAWDFLSRWEILGVSYRKEDKVVDNHQLLNELVALFADFLKAAGSDVDGVVLLIDEADKPEPSAHLGSFIKLFTEKLAFLHTQRVLIVLAGLPVVMQKLKESHESSPRILQTITLEVLTQKESKQVIDLGLEEAEEKNGFKTSISQEAKDRIVELSEGYPHFLQQFSYDAFSADRDGLIDEQDVKAGSTGEHGSLVQLGKKFFEGMYFAQIQSDDYRKVLNTMAAFGDAWVSKAEIVKRSKLKDATVTNAVKALKERRIIYAQDGVRGQYRLPTKSFAVWIKATQNLDVDVA